MSQRVPPRWSAAAGEEQKRGADPAGEAGEDRAQSAGGAEKSRQRDAADVASGGRGHTPGQGLRLRVRDGVPRQTSGGIFAQTARGVHPAEGAPPSYQTSDQGTHGSPQPGQVAAVQHQAPDPPRSFDTKALDPLLPDIARFR